MEEKKKQLSSKTGNMRTICEVQREIYDILYEHYQHTEHYDEIVKKLEEIYVMGKKMDAKLRQYRFNYDDGWWEKERADIMNEKLSKRKNRK